MADDGAAQSTTVWPLPKFHFVVRFGDGSEMTFQEVSGLSTETDVIQYRHGNSPVFGLDRMPGLKKFGNVTMKKGIFKGDNKFWDWFNEIKMNTVKRQDVTVSLLDEKGSPAMVWTLHNAFPTKITATDLKSTGNEVAVESIELAFETLTVANP